jgi:hypothetical protein
MLPVRDRLFDGSQRLRGDDRTGNDDACCRFTQDHKVGPQPKHPRLHSHAHGLGDRTEPAGNIRHSLLLGGEPFVQRHPAIGHGGGHPDRQDDLRVAPGGFRQASSFEPNLLDTLSCRTGGDLRAQGRDDDQHRADQDRVPDPGMKQEAERGVERHPRQIEEGNRTRALQERPDLIKITAGQ